VVRLYLKHTLEAMPSPACEVAEAANGLEGLQALEHKAFDLVFCDLDMPLLDGRDLCSIIRGHGRQQQRIVIFTSDPHSRMEPQFLNDPGIIVLQKPASRLEIWDLVAQLLAA
jgi:CheY-like chemotaxis protein